MYDIVTSLLVPTPAVYCLFFGKIYPLTLLTLITYILVAGTLNTSGVPFQVCVYILSLFVSLIVTTAPFSLLSDDDIELVNITVTVSS